MTELHSEQSGQEQDYRTAWLLWRARRFIARMLGVGLVAGLVLALLIPTRYTAKAQLMPPDATGEGSLSMAAIAAGVADKAGGLGTAAADLLGFKSSGALFVEILKSRTVQDRLVDRFQLQKVYGCRHRVDAREVLQRRTEISEDRKSGVIQIEVTDRDRQRAQEIAKAYVEELNRVVTSSAVSAAARERAFIEQRIKEVQQEMNSSALAVAEFSSKNNTVDLKEQAKAMLDAVATVQGQLIAAQAEVRSLQSIYTADNFRVRSAQAQVAELKSQLKKLDGKERPDTDVAEYPTMRQLPVLAVSFEDLYRRNKVADAVYEALVQQYEMAKIREAKDTPNVQMLDVPEVPEIKSYPPRTLIVFGGCVFSFLFACGWVIGLEQWLAIEDSDTRKRLVMEVVATVAAHPMWRNRHVAKLRALAGQVARRLSPQGTKPMLSDSAAD